MENQKESLQITPLNGYAGEVGVWLAALQDTRRRTLRMLEKIKPHWVDFMPQDGGESIGTILYHLAVIETDWLYVEVLQEPSYPPEVNSWFPYDVRVSDGSLTPVTDTLQNHLERLRNVREKFLAGFLNVTADDFWRVRSLPEYDVTPIYVIQHLMQHEAEHRSQMDWIGLQAEKANY